MQGPADAPSPGRRSGARAGRSSNTIALRPGDADSLFLVGDFGGSSYRLALAQMKGGAVRLTRLQRYPHETIATPDEAIETFLAHLGWRPALATAVLAVAGPVYDGVAKATHRPWRLSEGGVKRHGFRQVKLVNDFSALAFAVSHLARSDTVALGPDFLGPLLAPAAVIGAGSGFGTGVVVRDHGQSMILAAESGHMSFAPADTVEIEILRLLFRRFGRVSVERLISGPGLGNLHWALGEIHGRPQPRAAPEASEIIRQAAEGESLGRETLERFAAIFGTVAGDCALAYGARGGIFLAGELMTSVLPFLQTGDFRRRFEDKGRLQTFVAAIPTRAIVNVDAALIGAAVVAAGLATAEG